jgi:hypothetical protein
MILLIPGAILAAVMVLVSLSEHPDMQEKKNG